MAFAAFGLDLNLSSIEWSRNGIQIENNDTVRHIAIAQNFPKLLISGLTIRSGAEDGTEGTFSCRACRNVSSPIAPQECREFDTELIAQSKCTVHVCVLLLQVI